MYETWNGFSERQTDQWTVDENTLSTQMKKHESW